MIDLYSEANHEFACSWAVVPRAVIEFSMTELMKSIALYIFEHEHCNVVCVVCLLAVTAKICCRFQGSVQSRNGGDEATRQNPQFAELHVLFHSNSLRSFGKSP